MDSLQYIASLIAKSPAWAQDLEKFAREHRVPIIDQISLQLLLQLVRLKRPERILEIGTAIAYSTLHMHEAVTDAYITTIEKNEKMYAIAAKNIARFKKSERIELIHGDAAEVIERFPPEKTFDFVFIDAAKSQYLRYFQSIAPHVLKGGVIVVDNVLFKQFVAQPEEAPKRFKTIVKNLRMFNEYVMKNEDFHSSLAPVGDGLMISIKRT